MLAGLCPFYGIKALDLGLVIGGYIGLSGLQHESCPLEWVIWGYIGLGGLKRKSYPFVGS